MRFIIDLFSIHLFSYWCRGAAQYTVGNGRCGIHEGGREDGFASRENNTTYELL